MKKIFLTVVGILVMSSHVHAATLQDLGVSSSDIAKLDTNPQCVDISGEQFDYAHGHSHIVRGNGKEMRLMVYQSAPPFEALAVIIDGRKVLRKVVQVKICDKVESQPIAHKKRPVLVASAPSEKKKEVVAVAQVTDSFAEVSPKQVEKSGTKKPVYLRGVFRSIDTLNLSVAEYSPFNGEDKERHGNSFNIKARIRPLQIGDVRLGAYGTYTDGESNTYRRSKDYWSYYDYIIYGGGLSALFDHGQFRTSELDFGWLYQETEGWIPSKEFRSYQDESQIDVRYKFASSNRRENGELWFPYWELGVHYVHPFNVSYHDTYGGDDELAYDNRRFRIWGMGDIYDFYLGDSNQWKLAPTINAELGYLWGKESGYIQGGLGAKLGWRGQDIFEIKILNPRLMFEENGSRIYDYIGTWKVDNSIRAFIAEQVTDYKPASEKGIIVVQ